ncbi:hypothetical protein [Aquimarina sp. LLG6339-5]|uniref:hypothetical protein n=1 Tax=Aquimarina sp. LLG6339-5 TaxID=3160830 RepID=UPI0038702BCB
MNKNKTYNIYWRNIEIGQFAEESMDMSYLDGKMISNDSKNAYQFIKIASELDIKSVMLNPQNGIRATLKDETDFIMNVLVLGLDENMELSLKMIVGKQETIDWYLKNVPEEKLLTTKPIVNTGFWYKIKNMFK